MKLTINEIFHSIQGEGVRAGTPNVFVRFSKCNLKCNGRAVGQSFQPICDTEFESGRSISMDELDAWIDREAGCDWSAKGGWLILTGGEPGLQLSADVIQEFRRRGYRGLAVETNGTLAMPDGLDWVTVSPKVAEHAIRQLAASEVRYVRGYGQAIPQTVVKADHYCVSPAFDGEFLRPDVLEWCIKLVKENPPWRLSLQTHKLMHAR